MNTTFSRISSGDLFWYASALYIKQSTRTARLLATDKPYYFCNNDPCKIAIDSRYQIIKYKYRLEVYFCEAYVFTTYSTMGDAIRKAIEYEENRMKSYNN